MTLRARIRALEKQVAQLQVLSLTLLRNQTNIVAAAMGDPKVSLTEIAVALEDPDRFATSLAGLFADEARAR